MPRSWRHCAIWLRLLFVPFFSDRPVAAVVVRHEGICLDLDRPKLRARRIAEIEAERALDLLAGPDNGVGLSQQDFIDGETGRGLGAGGNLGPEEFQRPPDPVRSPS